MDPISDSLVDLISLAFQVSLYSLLSTDLKNNSTETAAEEATRPLWKRTKLHDAVVRD